MKILITGATGLVGTKLLEELFTSGYDDVSLLTRNKEKASRDIPYPVEIFEWNPSQMTMDKGALTNVDTIIHLAGDGVADGRWSEKKKKRILESRVNTTKLLLEEIERSTTKPSKFISASAVGIYGNRGEESLDEESESSDGYLADVCKAWEDLVQNNNINEMVSCSLRIGVVLSAEGGALKKMLPAFKAGVAGPLGNGEQYMSWIHIDDLVGQIKFLIENKIEYKVYNATSPKPVTNYIFTKNLGKELKRLTLIPVPQFIIKIIFGEMSDILLNSQKVIPTRFISSGYKFKFRDIKDAFKDILKYETKGEYILKQFQWIDAPIKEVFDFFQKEKNLEKLTPKYLKFNVLGKTTPEIEEGTLIDYKLSLRGIPIKWKSRISSFVKESYFIDEQIKGPYAKWVHTHRFISSQNGTLMLDEVIYKVPFGTLGRVVGGWLITRDITNIFKYRKTTIKKFF